MKQIGERQRTEAFIAILLSFIGGILDVYCLYNFNIYALLHTGNIIKLAAYLVDGDWMMFLITLTIVLSFAGGVYLSNLYGHHHLGNRNRHSMRISMGLLVLAICIPNDVNPGVISPMKLGAGILFGLLGAFLTNNFFRFSTYGYSATTMTANINRLMTNLYVNRQEGKGTFDYSVKVYLLIFAMFIVGAIIGYAYMRFVPEVSSGFLRYYRYNLVLLIPLLGMRYLYSLL
ncbi:MAG: DUF1275 domain-containing protein [Solobacterium sp.]|nr:DUF1275 domain-containing protein [Solobacterium sp.]